MGKTPVDSAPLHGLWTATDEATAGLVRLDVREPDDGTLTLTAYAAGADGVVRLAEVEAHGYGPGPFGDGAASAMTAAIRSGDLSALLTFYLKGGILVLDAFITPGPRDARVPHYARELFHRCDHERQRDQQARGYGDERRTERARYTGVSPGDPPAPLNLTLLAGDWDNVNGTSPDVRRVTLSAAAGVRLQWSSDPPGAPADRWSPGVPFAVAGDDVTPIGFTSRPTAAGSEAIVTSYCTRGILVLDCHIRCHDERRDHLVREFFCRPWSPR